MVTYVVKFIIVSGMAQHSGCWGHCRWSLQFAGVDVSVWLGTSGISLTAWGFTVILRPKGSQLSFCLDPRGSLSRQLLVWPVAPDSSGTVTLNPVQERQSRPGLKSGFMWHCQWKDGVFKIYQCKDLQWKQLHTTDKTFCSNTFVFKPY